jgi:hypothetical protein
MTEQRDQRDQHDQNDDHDGRTGRAAAAARIQQQAQWVDLQIQRAIERGDFDNLPGYGKPIEGLGGEHDPDWWLKKLVERERITVLPAALQLRKDDAELDDLLDRTTAEADVRREVEEFNERIRQARRQLQGGPPVITQTRDVDTEVEAWRQRRQTRIQLQRQREGEAVSAADLPRRPWWRRR